MRLSHNSRWLALLALVVLAVAAVVAGALILQTTGEATVPWGLAPLSE